MICLVAFSLLEGIYCLGMQCPDPLACKNNNRDFRDDMAHGSILNAQGLLLGPDCSNELCHICANGGVRLLHVCDNSRCYFSWSGGYFSLLVNWSPKCKV
jgi:hypothetical protein